MLLERIINRYLKYLLLRLNYIPFLSSAVKGNQFHNFLAKYNLDNLEKLRILEGEGLILVLHI